MIVSERGRFLAAVLLLGLLGPGCAARSAYRQGQNEARKGHWDLAVARLTVALQKDPDNIEYKIALENARIQASRYHYLEARKQLAAEDLEGAANSLEIATKYDPSNRSASDDLEILRDTIRQREEEKRRLSEFEAMKSRAQAARVPVPVLSPRSPVPITIKFAEHSLEKIFESLGKLAGVNILFDQDFRDKKYTVSLANVTFQEALDQLTFVNRLFYKVLDQNTLIIVPETPQKRRTYDENLIRTFYLQNAEVNETLNQVKTLAGIQKATGNPSLGAITVMGTPDELALAERIIEANDKAKGEVMIEVQILNVDVTRAKNYGLKLSNYGAGLTFSPTGGTSPLPGGGSEVDIGASGSGFTNVRAHLLSSLNLADFVVSVPAQIFSQFLQSDSSTRILASPRLRAAEGKKTSLKIGQEVPVPVTTFQATQTGGTTFTPATSFQYRNVGVTLEITPKVNASGDITLELSAEFSLLGKSTPLGGQDLPTFLTRNVTGILRLRDGQTSLIGGLVQRSETDSFSGVFGLQSIPILNKLLTSRTGNTEENEILMSLTPHLVRAPKLTEEDLHSLYVGTKETVRVPSARPSLFGPLEPVPSPSPAAPAPPPRPLASPAPSVPTAAPPPTLPAAPPPTMLPAAPPEAAPSPGPETPPAGTGAETRPAAAVFSPAQLGLKVGGSGALALVALNVRELLAVEVTLAYDPTAVEAVDAGPGSLLTLDGASVGSEKALESGRVRVRFTRPSGVAGSGAVVVVTFRGVRAGVTVVGVESLVLRTRTGEERPAAPALARVVVGP